MTDPALLRAILAMDVYNRGDLAGTATDLPSQIGSATLVDSAIDPDSGFFAAAYRIGQEIVISYRGTNFSPLSALLEDALAWAGGGGWPTAQAAAAAAFYRRIRDNPDLLGDHVTFTGHSLGGGLAGLMASLYGKGAIVFDSMPFALAADNVFYNATHPLIEDGMNINPDYQYTLDTYYGAATPQQPDGSHIAAVQVNGQVIEYLSPSGVMLESGSLDLSPIALHSISLLVVLQYGELQTGNWSLLKKDLIVSLFNDAIAKAAGAERVAGTNDPADKMRSMIAYTAIDDGPSPFGNVAIRSLFNDTGDISHLADTNDDLTLKLLGNFVEVATQYSALRAINKSTVPELAAGAASWDATSVTMGLTLARGGVNNDGRVVGLENALSNVITTTTGIPSFGDSLSALSEYFGTFTETLLSGLSMIKATATSMTSLDGSSAEKGAFLIGLKNSGQNTFKGGDEGTNVMSASGTENVFDLSKGNNIVLLTDAGTATLDTSMHGDPLHSINWNMVQGTAGEDTFKFQGSDLAPLTIVYGGNMGDTFDFEVGEGKGVSVYLLQMDDLNAQNFLSLDPDKIAEYISEGDGNNYGGGVDKIVIINPDANDILKYNEQLVSDPSRYKLSERQYHAEYSYNKEYVPFSVDPDNYLKMIGPDNVDNTRAIFSDGWREIDETEVRYALKSGNIDMSVNYSYYGSVQGFDSVNGLFLNWIKSETTNESEDVELHNGYINANVGLSQENITKYYSDVDLGTPLSDYDRVRGLYFVGFNNGDFGIDVQANNGFGSQWTSQYKERRVTEWNAATVDLDATNHSTFGDHLAENFGTDIRVWGRDPKTFGDTITDESDSYLNYDHDYYIVGEDAFGENMKRANLSIYDFSRDPIPPTDDMGESGSQDQFARSSNADDTAAESPDGSPGNAQTAVAASWKSEDERIAELKERGLDADGNPVTDFGLGRVFGTGQDNIPDIGYKHSHRFAAWQNSNEQRSAGVGELRAMPEAGIRLLNLLFDKEEIKLFADAIPGTSSLQMADGTTRLVSDPTLAFRPSMSPAA